MWTMVNKLIAMMLIEHFKEWTGKGPRNIRVYTVDNVLLADIIGVLTPLEQNLLRCGEENKKLIIDVRNQLIQKDLAEFARNLGKIIGKMDLAVKSYTFDFDFENDRQILVYILNHPIKLVIEAIG